MAVDHYENFPVASLLLPARLRPAVQSIYAFARSADDLADEGDALPDERLAALGAYDAALTRIARDEPAQTPMLRALEATVRAHALPLQPFHDLLSAFAQDVTVKRYPDFAALADYCRRSANPVGALMLHLYGAATPENLQASDAICTALQLINFIQDIAIDWRKDRVYLPQDSLRRFGVDEAQIADGDAGGAWPALMRFETGRARTLMLSGAPLARRLPGRIGWELRLVVQGGLRILERIDAVNGDVFRRRPTLGKADWLVLAARAARMR